MKRLLTVGKERIKAIFALCHQGLPEHETVACVCPVLTSASKRYLVRGLGFGALEKCFFGPA